MRYIFALLLIIFLVSPVAARDPLIFFSMADDPNGDPVLLQMAASRFAEADLNYGSGAMRYLIIDDTLANGYDYNIMRQVAEFIIWNSQHWNGPLYTQQENIFTLFYTDKPLRLSCGKIASFFRQLAEAHLALPRSHWRYMSIYDYRALDPASVSPGYYLNGGHAVIEMWFEEHQKWGMIDLDMGHVPQDANGTPVNMLDLSHMTDSEVAATMEQLGQEQYGKGPSSGAWKDPYYQEARHIFSVYDQRATPPTYVFLYTGPEGQGEQFRQNFLDTYDNTPGYGDIEVEIVLDEVAFKNRFYKRP